MNYFTVPTRWAIPAEALRLSMKEMAIDGANGHEGVAMWLGTYEGITAVVTHIVVLRGSGIHKAPDQLLISSALVNDLTDLAIENNVTLVGQIHSHGPIHGTYLSLTDKKFGIKVPGYLSVVAPDYAMRAHTAVHDCGVHVYEPETDWRRFSQDEIAERIVITTSASVPVLIAGI